ncbi:MobC family plasmid mobilization relaxosome protein [Maribacter litopenaei]|uniref:MobC family plasmid mobilization relaxosome protein n=1 Tax=Maribacter litopenaei TaxID=2976127 RepID=A0ABY5Y9J4_9FLAO|nr:MobC family plasmid mobilization relaxosome protein [Maribacter litopenaei]UWX54914.1 MobC family plasmid mobilization relaxosome protein [Maribacter litopenaei]
MKPRKRGRKRLGNKKRYHNVMLRFNDAEYEKLRAICESYNLDICQRGTLGPLLRRLILNGKTEEKERLPDTLELAYHINRIGNNINQLVKLAHHKNLINPNGNLDADINRTNELLYELLEITMKA